MLKRTATLFVLASLAVLTAPSDVRADELDDFCADRWPRDNTMIKRCVKKQVQALHRVGRFHRRYDVQRKARQNTKMDPYGIIFLDCSLNAEVPNNNTTNYVKFARCLDKREKAHKARHPDGK